MLSRDIDTVIQSINKIQNQANDLYWDKFWETVKPFLPFINVGPEQQILLGVVGGELLREGYSPKLLFGPQICFALLGVVFAYCTTKNTVEEINNIEITNGHFNHLASRFKLKPDQINSFQAVLEKYKVKGKINLKDLKSMLTEVNQLNKHQASWFNSNKTVDDILSKYSKSVSEQPIIRAEPFSI